MSLEYTTLEKCANQLESAFRADVGDVAQYLFNAEFITSESFEEVLEPRSTYSHADQAAKLKQQVMGKVKHEPSNYYKLINYLRQNKKKYDNIVDVLDAEYFGIRKCPASLGMNSDDLHKELSALKSKWQSIGEGLKVPRERLDQFVGLTDPLLEVIVHWLKGGGDPPPSWDVVVVTLRDPGVGEAELADKIHRLYCGRRQEIEKKEDQTSVSSGVTSGLRRVPLKSNYHLRYSDLESVPLKSNYHFSKSEMEYERHKLKRKTNEIKRHFGRFFAKLQQHMLNMQKDEKLDTSVIKNQIMMYDNELAAPISKCTSLQDIFETLCSPEHLSFFDYELIKLFVEILVDYGGDKLLTDFIDYKRKLQKFFESRLIERNSGGEKSFAVLIDESIAEETTNMSQLQNRVNFILGHKKLDLILWENLTKSLVPPEAEIEEKPTTEAKAVVTSALNTPQDDSPEENDVVQNSTPPLEDAGGVIVSDSSSQEGSGMQATSLGTTSATILPGKAHKEADKVKQKIKKNNCSLVVQLVAFFGVLTISVYFGMKSVSSILYDTPQSYHSVAPTNVDETTFPECWSIDKDDRYAISLQRLTLLPYLHKGKKKELKVIKELCTAWKDLGLLFDYNVDMIAQSYNRGRGYVEDCCRDVLTRWLSKGAKGYPISWNGLIKALKGIDLTRLTLEIQDALKCSTVE